jgi:hypothetical protein
MNLEKRLAAFRDRGAEEHLKKTDYYSCDEGMAYKAGFDALSPLLIKAVEQLHRVDYVINDRPCDCCDRGFESSPCTCFDYLAAMEELRRKIPEALAAITAQLPVENEREG